MLLFAMNHESRKLKESIRRGIYVSCYALCQNVIPRNAKQIKGTVVQPEFLLEAVSRKNKHKRFNLCPRHIFGHFFLQLPKYGHRAVLLFLTLVDLDILKVIIP
jgi:hypothetical protein